MHTDVVHCDVSCAARSQASVGSSVVSALVPQPPGNTITSGLGTSVSARSACSASIEFSVRLGPGSEAMKCTVASGRRERTS